MRHTCLSLLVLAFCLTCVAPLSSANPSVLTNPQVSYAGFAVTFPLRDLIQNQQDMPFGYHEAGPLLHPKLQQFLANQRANFAAQEDPWRLPAITLPTPSPPRYLTG